MDKARFYEICAPISSVELDHSRVGTKRGAAVVVRGAASDDDITMVKAELILCGVSDIKLDYSTIHSFGPTSKQKTIKVLKGCWSYD